MDNRINGVRLVSDVTPVIPQRRLNGAEDLTGQGRCVMPVVYVRTCFQSDVPKLVFNIFFLTLGS